MASFVLKNAFVLINAVDLSDHIKQVTVNYSAALQDNTPMGKASLSRLPALKDWSLDVQFFNDYAAAKVDATIFPIVGTQIAVEVRPDAGARSATNPGYTGNGIVESYQPVAGSVGDVAMAPVKISGSDGVALIRNIV
jgi:hypothetical protein